MGLILDIILCCIVVGSIFLGYKKGFVKLASKLVAGLIAIVLTFVFYKPVSNMVIKNTTIDEKIESAIVENTKKFVTEKANEKANKESNGKVSVSEGIVDQIDNGFIAEQAASISDNIVYVLTGIVLYVFIKIAISLVISLLDIVAKLPILKQFNEVGGLVYGGLRGIIISVICILMISVVVKINPDSKLKEAADGSILVNMFSEKIGTDFIKI